MTTISINQGDSLATKLTTANALYVISGTYDLADAEINVPRGSTLVFDNGSKIKNGKLALNNTVFEGAKHSIATEVCGVQDELDTDYFDLTLSNKTAIMQSIVNTADTIQLHGRLENVFNNITIGEKNTSIIGNGAKIINTTTRSVTAFVITTNCYCKIEDIEFVISSGCAISKNAGREGNTKLSFIIDRCRFKSTSKSNVPALIELINSREGNITNCFFEYSNGNDYYGSIGIDRGNAVNTNVIGCMFSNLNYGIKAIGQHVDGPVIEGGDGDDQYTSYACGLNVQSAVMLGCKYGIYIEGNDSFFLNNSMIDYCTNPLVIISQDGANITNNYFSTSTSFDTYNAVITLRNNPNKTAANENKRIIISSNTIYGHRTTNCNGIDMVVECIDCTIQGNTFDFFTNYGINLIKNNNPGTGWSTEKLVIDNNRFYFGNFANNNIYVNMYGINGTGYTGGSSAIIMNNYAIENKYDYDNDVYNIHIHISTKLIKANDSYAGSYLSFGNHDYLKVNSVPDAIRQASIMNHSRMKLELTMQSTDTQLEINNPMPGEPNLVVYVANNPCPINVSHLPDQNSSSIIFTKAVTNDDITFTAIIERTYNL